MLGVSDSNLMVRKINAFSQAGSSILNNLANIDYFILFFIQARPLCKFILFYTQNEL
jgi:hypothetical protein